MSPHTPTFNLRVVVALAGVALVAVALSAFVACTEGTTPDCSGNPSPCGYDLPAPANAGSQTDGGE
jgi:hypothetical protein